MNKCKKIVTLFLHDKKFEISFTPKSFALVFTNEIFFLCRLIIVFESSHLGLLQRLGFFKDL